VSLYIFSTRTEEFFSWTIRAPLTAAFMGAGYWAALPTFVMALRSREWQYVRILVVVTFVFAAFAAIVTLRDIGSFHLGTGPLFARVTAWVWLVVYIVLPVVMLASVVIQERAGGSAEYAIRHPLLGWVRAALLVQAIIATGIGVGLVFASSRLAGVWPWPLAALPAGAIGGWILSFAAGSWWALRDSDWSRIRLTIPFYLLFYVLLLIAAARFWDTLTGDAARRWIYVGVLLAAFVMTAFAAVLQEKRPPQAERLAAADS
jgi:hypothetical protein